MVAALGHNAFEPEWEARSYGFRPGRNCYDAISAIYATCKGLASVTVLVRPRSV